ncbi:MAG TPA: hypothetical protein VGB26_03590 [Nitrospiria bacterium]|jgi:hypothetical protein
MSRIMKKGSLFLCCAFVVFGVAFLGCTPKEEEAEEKGMPSMEAPASEMGEPMDEKPMPSEEEGEEMEGEMTEEPGGDRE